MRATDGTSRIALLRDGPAGWPIFALVAASILFALAIGVFLIIRRVGGALTAPPTVPQLVATAAGLCVWATIVHELAAKRQAFIWLPLCAVLLFAVGCSYPANRVVDWLVWSATIGLVFLPPFVARMKAQHPTLPRSPARDDVAIAEQVLQQLTRVRTAEGRDVLRGTLVARFTPGERQITLYVGFCPPFEMLPKVEAKVIDDFEADVKLAQVLHNGAQIDVRLSEPAEEPLAVTMEFFAVEAKSPNCPTPRLPV